MGKGRKKALKASAFASLIYISHSLTHLPACDDNGREKENKKNANPRNTVEGKFCVDIKDGN